MPILRIILIVGIIVFILILTYFNKELFIIKDTSISSAKDKLYRKLSKFNQVSGISIRKMNNELIIVVLLDKLDSRIERLIPTEYLGYKVTYEIIGKISTL
jgi:hypothetical protein